jgi:hypothetical protein
MVYFLAFNVFLLILAKPQLNFKLRKSIILLLFSERPEELGEKTG